MMTSSLSGSELVATWEKTKTFTESAATRVHSRVLAGRGKPGKVISYTDRLQTVPPSVGMNTVMLLKLAANSLGMSPHKAMEVAERLYIAGEYFKTICKQNQAPFHLPARAHATASCETV